MNMDLKCDCKRARWIFWFILLFVALFTQIFVRLHLNRAMGEYVSGISLVSIVNLVYFIVMCSYYKDRKNILQEECRFFFVEDGMDEGVEEAPSSLSDRPQGNAHDSNIASGDANTESTNVTSSRADYIAPINDDADDTNQNSSDNPPQKKRLFYLDNVKIFLTILVVSHHVSCAFGGCGPGSWVLIVGLYDNSFRPFLASFTLLNQAYFMSLFFFISAYFVPSSLERKGRKAFLYDKAKRYWIPALFVTIIMAPLMILYFKWFANQDLVYVPTPFQCWFLFWLLLLNLAYVHIRGDPTNDNSTDEDQQEPQEQKLPGPLARTLIYGLGLCGGAMALILVLLDSASFGAMPMAPGSLVNDLLFFAGGVVARKHGWLEKNLTEQVGMPIILLRSMVVVEAAVMIFLLFLFNDNELFGLPLMLVTGIYCMDMSLAMMELFQSHLDFQNKFMKFLSDAAYTVYIIHPVFVIGVTSVWVSVYQSVTESKLEWTGFGSTTPIEGGGLTLGIGWLVSNVLVHLLLWPFSWYLRKLPGIRQIL